MIRVRLYEPIANEENRWWYEWMGSNGVFSLDAVNKLLDEHPQETDFAFDIHCAGGEVEEGLAIYDKLRTSGKNIFMNVEGGCHSMAIVLLLAAPLQNRSANANALAVIHKVSGWAEGTSDDLEAAAHDTRMLEEKILDIYADRTGKDKDALRELMNQQKEHTAKELLDWGFIGKINPYNTNYVKPNKQHLNMAKNLKTLVSDFLNSVQKFTSGAAKNYEFVDADGNVLFTTEGEDDTLEVGMAASPDGEFVIADGRKVTIVDGVITEIENPAAEGEGEGKGEEQTDLETANARIAELEAENAELREQLTNSVNLIKDLRSNLRSNFTPAGRQGGPAKKPTDKKVGEENKAAIRERMNAAKGKKTEENK